MWKVLTCLTAEHDYWLVLLAVAVCVTTCLIAFRLYAQAQRESRFFRNLWLAATGVCAGSGVWATHFIAMLAYKPGLQVRYEPIQTTLSWLVAVGGMGARLHLGQQAPLAGRPARRRRRARPSRRRHALPRHGRRAHPGRAQWDWAYVGRLHPLRRRPRGRLHADRRATPTAGPALGGCRPSWRSPSHRCTSPAWPRSMIRFDPTVALPELGRDRAGAGHRHRLPDRAWSSWPPSAPWSSPAAARSRRWATCARRSRPCPPASPSTTATTAASSSTRPMPITAASAPT